LELAVWKKQRESSKREGFRLRNFSSVLRHANEWKEFFKSKPKVPTTEQRKVVSTTDWICQHQHWCCRLWSI
jgi:hypothetical protein